MSIKIRVETSDDAQTTESVSYRRLDACEGIPGNLRHDGEERNQPGPRAHDPGGPARGHRLGGDDASGVEGPDTARTERMDLLGDLPQASRNAHPPNRTRGRGAQGGQAPPLL